MKEQLAKRRQKKLVEVKRRQELRKKQEMDQQETEKVEARLVFHLIMVFRVVRNGHPGNGWKRAPDSNQYFNTARNLLS